jgi:hypothetical protein
VKLEAEGKREGVEPNMKTAKSHVPLPKYFLYTVNFARFFRKYFYYPINCCKKKVSKSNLAQNRSVKEGVSP